MIAVVSPTVKLHYESLVFGKATLLSKHGMRKRDLFVVLYSNRMEKVTTSFTLDNYIQPLLLHPTARFFSIQYEIRVKSPKQQEGRQCSADLGLK